MHESPGQKFDATVSNQTKNVRSFSNQFAVEFQSFSIKYFLNDFYFFSRASYQCRTSNKRAFACNHIFPTHTSLIIRRRVLRSEAHAGAQSWWWRACSPRWKLFRFFWSVGVLVSATQKVCGGFFLTIEHMKTVKSEFRDNCTTSVALEFSCNREA